MTCSEVIIGSFELTDGYNVPGIPEMRLDLESLYHSSRSEYLEVDSKIT
jgi:hypothetical protein